MTITNRREIKNLYLGMSCYEKDKIYIFDFDGTIADSKHRHHFLQDEIDGITVPKTGTNKDWTSFFAAQDQDIPFDGILLIMKALYQAGYVIIILTARPENQRNVSVDWLKRYNVKYDALIMRPTGCREDDTTLKVHQLKQYFSKSQRQRIQTIFEDRRRVVQSLRAAGYHVCHVEEGDF